MRNQSAIVLTEAAEGNRRRHSRTARRFSVEVLNIGDDPSVPSHVDFVPGEAMDVSSAGICVYVPYDVGKGRELGLVVRNNDDMRIFVGRIKWKKQRENGILYGLHVTKSDPSRLP